MGRVQSFTQRSVKLTLFLSIAFLLVALAIWKSGSWNREPESGICLTPTITKEGIYSTVHRMVPYLKKYRHKVRVLSLPSIHGYRANELLGFPPCTRDDESIAKKLPVDAHCVTIPGLEPCEWQPYLSLNETSKAILKFFGRQKCHGMVDLVVHERGGDMRILEDFDIRSPKMIWRNDTIYAIKRLRKVLNKEMIIVVVYNEDEKSAYGVSRVGQVIVKGGSDVRESLKFLQCAQYGLVGLGGYSRLIVDAHKVQTVLCHSPVSCKFMKSSGLNVLPLDEL